jgi:hypothetical protein
VVIADMEDMSVDGESVKTTHLAGESYPMMRWQGNWTITARVE